MTARVTVMKIKKASLWGRYRGERLSPVLWFLVSLLIAVLGGILLFGHGMIDGLITTIINVGLDPLRSQLIAALIMTAGAALIGAALGRRKSGALVGAGIIFCFAYLLGFIQSQLQPVLDPGGHPEPLNNTALLHNACIMLGIGLLSAFIGAAVGLAFGEVLLDPPFGLIRFLWQHVTQRRNREETAEQQLPLARAVRAPIIGVISRWLAAGAVVSLLIAAVNSGDLFIFSPDVGIHTKPRLSENMLGTVVPDTLVSSSLGKQRRPFLIYLPASYNTAQGKHKSYPTLYLLHGSPGKDIDWITGGKATESADTLIASGKIPDMIMIFPDGNGRPGASSEWGNSYDGGQLIENYVFYDLVRYVDQHYRTIADPAHRALGGLSMGGFGAMNIAIHHPDVFGTIISLGGYYRAEGGIWEKNATYMQLNSPINTITYTHQAWQLQMYLGAATKDQPYYTDTLEFMKVLDKLHIHYQFDLEKGYHSWHIWQKQLYNALLWLRWAPTKASPTPKIMPTMPEVPSHR